MKLTYLFLLSLAFSSFAQTDQKQINQTGVDGLRHGEWILLWKDMDTLHRCGSGTSCPPDKLAESYKNEGYSPDAKFMSCIYVNGKIEGPVIKYYPDGKIMSKRFYVNGKTDGLYESFYPGGSLKETGFIKNGTQAGISSQYYESGVLKDRVIFTNEGKLNGHWIKYYENGIVKSILMYYAGKRNGYGLVFDSTAKLTEKYYYVDGQKVDASKEKKPELDIILSVVHAENIPVFSKRKLIEEEIKRSKVEIEKQKVETELENQKIQKELDEQRLKNEFEKKQIETRISQERKDIQAKEEKKKQRIILYSVIAGLFLVLMFAIFIFKSYRQKQKANTIITLQKEEVEKQKKDIEEKQKEILDSLRYAKRIQNSLLPTEKYIDKVLNK